MFENKLTHNGIHYSRYIASFEDATGRPARRNRDLFKRWLEEEQELTPEEVQDIWQMASNGKLELEVNAARWIKNHEHDED